MYAGEVHHVAAGYARNYLIPKQMAVYATERNFERCGLVDPQLMLENEVTERDEEEDNEDLKAADLLRKYLRNKTVKIIRNVDLNTPTLCHPGHVSAKNLRDKLSSQLKIDLEPHETIQIRNAHVVGLEEMEEKEMMGLIMGMEGGDEGVDCDTKVKHLGDYLAKITLAGGYAVPLQFRVERR
ncbi:predicted protein [Thalassiosira pseudonana CCMP1335]|uniref:Ribosomal protein L9 domain-containing protein n=1 Tax=Thalassiosira pseudonana TaxID=35128 RepID=B8C9N4_THAPS|nr:predicted protein [Thalassiosira pseudonana CCMP1335]EED89889.1 predicted protein [Thalassiosira pseudonana CCMP1335]